VKDGHLASHAVVSLRMAKLVMSEAVSHAMLPCTVSKTRTAMTKRQTSGRIASPIQSES